LRHLLAVASVWWDWGREIVLATIILPLGAWLRKRIADRQKQEEARSAARALDRALLYVVAEICQIYTDAQRWQEYMTSTQGRLRPIDPEELVEQRVRLKQRLETAAKMLWELHGHEQKRGRGADEYRQDMLRAEDLEPEERER
jgi:hypothetical protein